MVVNLFIIVCVSHIDSTKAECTASEIRRLKTNYRSALLENHKGDINFLELKTVIEVDATEVIDMFINLHPKRLITKNNSEFSVIHFCRSF